MKSISSLTLILLFYSTICNAQTNLSVEIKNIKNTKGTVRIALFNNENGFPSNDKMAYKVLSAKIIGNTATFIIPNIPFGKYAIVVFHDENNNGKVDTNFFGKPTEATGTSNANEKATGKPNYNNALINITEKSKNISIKLFY